MMQNARTGALATFLAALSAVFVFEKNVARGVAKIGAVRATLALLKRRAPAKLVRRPTRCKSVAIIEDIMSDDYFRFDVVYCKW